MQRESDHGLDTIDIILIDNHPILREGLGLILSNQRDLRVVGEGSDGNEAVDLFRRHRPDVAILDLCMPNMNGIDATKAILRFDPRARILIFTTFDGDNDIHGSFSAGAKGYVLKDAPRSEVLHAIRCVHRGERYMAPGTRRKLEGRFGAQPLTNGERRVLRFLIQGMANKAIAAKLGIGEGTVKTHVNAVRQKLGASNRTEAALAALRSGLFTMERSPPGRRRTDLEYDE